MLDHEIDATPNRLHLGVNLNLANATRTVFRSLNALVAPLVTRGVGNPLPVGVGVVVVETTGRRSGLPRRVPLLSARAGDTILVSTVRSNSQWVANLAETPRAAVRLFGQEYPVNSAVGRAGNLQLATLRIER